MISVLGRILVTLLIFFVLAASGAVVHSAGTPRMRPYAGIGLVAFSASDRESDQKLGLVLYEDPGLSRIGMLESSKLSGNDWLFGAESRNPPLIVSARKGDWLRVNYDNAGREAWIDPQDKGSFLSWEQFLKMQTAHMLPGLQSQHYRLQQQPGGKQLRTLTPKQVLKVLKLDKSWSMVLIDQTQIGWLRWRDDDGRLLVGFEH